MLSPETSHEQGSDLKQAFLRHLPERIGAIEENWNILNNEGWSQVKLSRLFQRIQDLAGSSGKFGLIEVSEKVFSLEQYFRIMVHNGQQSSQEKAREISALIKNLKAVAGHSRQSGASTILQKDANKTRIHYLRINNSLAPGLGGALESLNCSVQIFQRVDDLLKAIDRQAPDALIIEAQMLGDLDPLKTKLNQLKTSKGNSPAMTVISNSSKLDIRLHSMRAGAAAFFVAPLDISSVATRIKQLAAPNTNKSFRIMIVDDDPSQADFAAAILRKADMETCTVTEPLQVLNTLDTFRPDLILMDLYMPDADGMELTSIIREQDEFIGIPIVFVSGEQDTDKQLDALSAGGDDFIAKPIRPRHLMSTIKNRVQRARALQQQNSAQSARDSLTGLFNRRHFFERLDSAVASDPPHPAARAVLYASLDHNEESIQQQLGIGQTDALLAEIGSLLASITEPQDVCARIEDNGFVIMAKRPLNKNLQELAQTLTSSIAEHHFENASPKTQPTFSVGICYFQTAPDDATGLVGRAHNACSQAAQNGGNQIKVYGDENLNGDASGTQQDTLALVRDALDESGFQVLFQPFIDIHDRESENYQMVLRLRTEEGDQLGPPEFMLAAQQAGLARGIDRWLISSALDVLDERRQSGTAVKLLVNQSVESLSDDDAVEWLRDELRRRLLVGTGLILEYNLIDIAGNLKRARGMVEDFKSMGVAVCLARFGHNDASYKISHYLGTEYIKVAEKMLTADASITNMLIKHMHQNGCKIIVPRMDDPRLIGQQWLSGADYVQADAVRPLPETIRS